MKDELGECRQRGHFVPHAKNDTCRDWKPVVPHPLSDKLNDPERIEHVALGLMLVSGSDLNWVDRQVKDAESGISQEDKRLLRANWKLVRARLESEGYV